MCRSREYSSSGDKKDYKSYSRRPEKYRNSEGDSSYDQVVYDEQNQCSGGKYYDYMRLSPMSSYEDGDDLTLWVEYNGKTYYREINEDSSTMYYYIDVSDQETDQILPLKAIGAYNTYPVLDSGQTPFNVDEDDLIIAENDYAQGANLYFNIMKFQQGDEIKEVVSISNKTVKIWKVQ